MLFDIEKKNNGLPNANRIKQFEVRWSEKIGTLEEIISKCDILRKKKGDAFLTTIEMVHHLNGPHIVHSSELISRDTLKDELDELKKTMAIHFDDN